MRCSLLARKICFANFAQKIEQNQFCINIVKKFADQMLFQTIFKLSKLRAQTVKRCVTATKSQPKFDSCLPQHRFPWKRGEIISTCKSKKTRQEFPRFSGGVAVIVATLFVKKLAMLSCKEGERKSFSNNNLGKNVPTVAWWITIFISLISCRRGFFVVL